jgi:hypothetical protein
VRREVRLPQWLVVLWGVISGALTILSFPSVPDNAAAWAPLLGSIDDDPLRWALPTVGWIGVALLLVYLRWGSRIPGATETDELAIGVEMAGLSAARTGLAGSAMNEWFVYYRSFRITNKSPSRRMNIDVRLIGHIEDPDGTKGEIVIPEGGWRDPALSYALAAFPGDPEDLLVFPLALGPEDTESGPVGFFDPFFRGDDVLSRLPEDTKFQVIDHVSEARIELDLHGDRYP